MLIYRAKLRCYRMRIGLFPFLDNVYSRQIKFDEFYEKLGSVLKKMVTMDADDTGILGPN